jgi:hypothetical protein
VGYFGDASIEQLKRWNWFALNARGQREYQRAKLRAYVNAGSDRSDPAGDGDDADSNQHGDGHAGPDSDATGGVAAGPVLNA